VQTALLCSHIASKKNIFFTSYHLPISGKNGVSQNYALDAIDSNLFKVNGLVHA
jgi:hypothetical protein